MDAHEPVNILMVDDQPDKLLSYEIILRELGENLIMAGSGREALEYLLHTDVALILLDVNMPEIDGFELATLIRQHPRYQQIAIIFISAIHHTYLDQLKGYEHGAIDYITVQIIPDLLRAKVRVFVELYRKTIALRREMAERQRLEREAQRVQHFALLGRLAAGVSHEIRNPLSAIFLNVDVLEEELRQPSPESVSELTQALTEIKTQLARLDDLLQDYLSLARVATIERTPQDLGVAVQAWAQEWLLLAIPQEVRLRLEGVEHLDTVPFHASTLRRAILNLVQNALDAMPQGGTLTLRGEGTATQVQLQVRDTGNGIPAEQLPHIFEPLYTTKPEGTGLGLYLMQEIVAAHGGKVMVESVVGQGTTFTLTLPRAVKRNTSADRGDDELSDSPGGKKQGGAL
jgi:signal transduction histidine kinase